MFSNLLKDPTSCFLQAALPFFFQGMGVNNRLRGFAATLIPVALYVLSPMRGEETNYTIKRKLIANDLLKMSNNQL